MVPLPEKLETRVPRKWPDYVQINRTKTSLAVSANGADLPLKGAALLMSGKDLRRSAAADCVDRLDRFQVGHNAEVTVIDLVFADKTIGLHRELDFIFRLGGCR